MNSIRPKLLQLKGYIYAAAARLNEFRMLNNAAVASPTGKEEENLRQVKEMLASMNKQLDEALQGTISDKPEEWDEIYLKLIELKRTLSALSPPFQEEHKRDLQEIEVEIDKCTDRVRQLKQRSCVRTNAGSSVSAVSKVWGVVKGLV